MSRRDIFVFGVAGLVGLLLLAYVGYVTISLFGWPPKLDPVPPSTDINPDLLGVESAMLAGAALVLTVIGAFVAVAAYLFSIRVPDLRMAFTWGGVTVAHEVRFTLSGNNEAPAPLKELAPGSQLSGDIRVTNAGKYLAKTPVVRLQLDGIRRFDPARNSAWKVMSKTPDGDPMVIQWTGLDMTIHGGFSHDLPTLDLLKSAVDPNASSRIVAEVAADGWRARKPTVLRVSVDGDLTGATPATETRGMKRSSTVAGGIGSIAFGVLTPLAIFVGGPMGGTYAAKDVASYISSGHVVVAGAMALCGLLGVAGLVCLGAYLRQRAESEASGSIWPQTLWGLIVGGAICFAVSWGIFVSQPIANNEAGTNLNIPPTITYAIGIAGDEVLFESAATLLGFALILLAVCNLPRLPAVLRWTTLVIGVLGITSLAFFTFFPLLIWAIVMGAWLLASNRTAA